MNFEKLHNTWNNDLKNKQGNKRIRGGRLSIFSIFNSNKKENTKEIVTRNSIGHSKP
jgi:hypothetical protein